MRPAVQGFLSLKTPTMASLNKDFALKIFFEENGYDKNEKKLGITHSCGLHAYSGIVALDTGSL